MRTFRHGCCEAFSSFGRSERRFDQCSFARSLCE
jgi:hypothetical protein